MRRSIFLTLLVFCLLTTTVLPQATKAQSYPPVKDPATGINYGGRFRQYWETTGGLSVFGHPKTNEGKLNFKDCGGGRWELTVQYFERVRMELHTENSAPYDVLLGALGCELSPSAQWKPVTPHSRLTGNCQFFPETNQNLCGKFAERWRRNGLDLGDRGVSGRESLALFGLGITQVRQEDVEKKPYQVQWTERTRFEHHTELLGTEYEVLLGLLGNEMIAAGKANVLAFVRTPAGDEQALQQIAGQNELRLGNLANEELAIFTPATGDGSALLAVPTVEPFDLSALQNRAIGGLRVIADGISPLLRADTYVVTLADPKTLLLVGTQKQDDTPNRVSLPAVIRALSTPVPHPLVMISRTQICFLSFATSVCGLLDLPLAGPDNEQINVAVEELRQVLSGTEGDLRDKIDTSQTIPLVAGIDALDTCATAFYNPEPGYDRCPATVLAAPTRSGQTFAAPDDPSAVGIGVIAVQQELREEVFKAPDREQPAENNVLPRGNYLVFALVRDGDERLTDNVSLSWVWLVGPAGNFYMPAVAGTNLIGEAVDPDQRGLPRPDATVTTSLILQETCFFKAPQCPYKPR